MTEINEGDLRGRDCRLPVIRSVAGLRGRATLVQCSDQRRRFRRLSPTEPVGTPGSHGLLQYRLSGLGREASLIRRGFRSHRSDQGHQPTISTGAGPPKKRMAMVVLNLSGRTLISLKVEYTVGTTFSGGYFVLISSPFTLETSDSAVRLSPDEDPPESFEVMRNLVGETITHSEISANGTLTLRFENCTQIVVEPDCSYEAWNMTGPDGLLVVCTPGGELAIWDGPSPGSTD